MKLVDVFRSGRPKPFGLRWWADGAPKHLFFADEKSRAKQRALMEKAHAKEGQAILRITADEVVQWEKCKQLLDGRNVSVVEAVEAYLKDRTWVRTQKTLPEAVKTFREAKKGEGVADDHLRQLRVTLDNFVATFGDRLALSPEDVRPWLFGLPFDAVTKTNYRKRLVTFYNFAVQNQWVQFNPFAAVKAPKVMEKEIELLTVAQARYLFRANAEAPTPVLVRLAVEAFAGLRYASACRFEFKDVNWTERGILLPAAKLKTARRQFIDGLPDNLWAWLELCRKRSEDWSIDPRAYLYQKSQSFDRATLLYRQEHNNDSEGSIPHPHNALRHSFASYHVAALKSPGRTAAILCHTNERKLWGCYKGNASEADGKAYFEIRPQVETPTPRKKR